MDQYTRNLTVCPIGLEHKVYTAASVCLLVFVFCVYYSFIQTLGMLMCDYCDIYANARPLPQYNVNYPLVFPKQKDRNTGTKSETRMAASVLKQDPNTKRFKRTLIYYDTDTQYANFRGNPIRQATKHKTLKVKQQLNG